MAADFDIVNQSLEMIGAQTRITALTDGSLAANAAQVLFQPTVNVVMREVDPAFARRTAALALSAAVTPVTPWAFEYLYPSDCLRMRQVRPAAGGYNVDDPQPVRASVAVDVIAAVPTKVILTDQANALIVYTSSIPTVAEWDSGFTEAVVRRLANPLALALAGRPDMARELLDEAERYSQLSEAIDEG